MVDERYLEKVQQLNAEPEYWSCQEVATYLGVTINNLRQLTYRKRIIWKRKTGKSVFYLAEEVIALKAKRA